MFRAMEPCTLKGRNVCLSSVGFYQSPSSQHLDISSLAAFGGSQILTGGLSRELPRRKMKPGVEQAARPRPLLVMQYVAVTFDCIHK